MKLEEKTLIANLKDPNRRDAAFESMMREHQKPIYWHIRKMVQDHDDADDLLQNTFIKAWRNIEKFRGDSQLKTWLFRIATNETLTFLNKRKKRQHTDLRDIQDDLQHSGGQVSTVTGEDIQLKLQEAVESLPDKQRLVFNMKYFEEMKYDEIVGIVGGTVGSLKASFHHAVKKIEKILQPD